MSTFCSFQHSDRDTFARPSPENEIQYESTSSRPRSFPVLDPDLISVNIALELNHMFWFVRPSVFQELRGAFWGSRTSSLSAWRLNSDNQTFTNFADVHCQAVGCL